jgi:hypothetical protein
MRLCNEGYSLQRSDNYRDLTAMDLGFLTLLMLVHACIYTTIND